LPGLLLALTVGTGLVDAVSYLTLGHVFVANMTGNVVFFGFAVAGVGGVSWSAMLLAVGCFGAGAFIGGRHGSARKIHRGRLLAATCGAQCVLVAVAAGLAAFADPARRGAAHSWPWSRCWPSRWARRTPWSADWRSPAPVRRPPRRPGAVTAC
jgi:uncharacterized membrane protein YoaK (UPF0700 family)